MCYHLSIKTESILLIEIYLDLDEVVVYCKYTNFKILDVWWCGVKVFQKQK